MNELTPLQRKIRGTKARRSRRKEPVSMPGRPVMPRNLSDEARKVWKRTVKLLEDRGTLTPGDGPAIGVYAEMTARYQVALESLTAGGLMQSVTVLDSNGRKVKRQKPNPVLKVVENCERILQVYLRNLGLTALTRDRVKKMEVDEDDSVVVGLKAFRMLMQEEQRVRKTPVN